VEAWRPKMEHWCWWAYKPVVADSHHFDEEQKPNAGSTLK